MRCNREDSTGDPLPDASFTNWSQDVTVTPTSIFQPNTVDQLVSIVKLAEANGVPVHAVGSGWSFTGNFSPGDNGYLVMTDSLSRILGNTMGAAIPGGLADESPNDPVCTSLTGLAKTRNLVHVEAGITLKVLHATLEAMTSVHGESQPRNHGFALLTMGGSGGQSIAGAISTSTHGGDANKPPLPDMVQGIHLVAPGGAEYFIQRGGDARIVDGSLLGEAMPCVAGRIISDDRVFNSVLVSLGRMGVIYSVVIEVRPQYALHEIRVQDTWEHVSNHILLGEKGTDGHQISDLRANNRYLQVLVLPYANSDGSRTCFVTTRTESDLGTLNPDPNKSNFFSFACELQPLQKSLLILGIIAAAWVAAAAGSWIPGIDAVTVAAAVAVTVALSPLLVPSITLGDYIAAVTNVMSKFGLFDAASGVVNSLLSSQQTPHDISDLSQNVMDTYDYNANCFKARSLEVSFDADATDYLDYLQDVFSLITMFSKNNKLYGGYISLRFCGKSEALLAIEKFKQTVCIEMSALSGLANDADFLGAFEQAAATRGAPVHWGQLNSRTRADTETVFSGNIGEWRSTLVRLSANGNIATFDNAYCVQRGLEPCGANAKHNPDTSYLVPLLMS